MGFGRRQSTLGVKRQLIFITGVTRSFKSVSVLLDRVPNPKASANTIERIALEVGNDLAIAEQEQRQSVLGGSHGSFVGPGESDSSRSRTGVAKWTKWSRCWRPNMCGWVIHPRMPPADQFDHGVDGQAVQSPSQRHREILLDRGR